MLHFRFVVQGFRIFVIRSWTEGGGGVEVRVSGLSSSNETDAGLFIAVGRWGVQDVGNRVESLPILPMMDVVDVMVHGVTVL